MTQIAPDDEYKPLDYSKIKEAAKLAEKSGGLSGSVRINLSKEKGKEQYWQYKFSLFKKKRKDWAKGQAKGGTDHENLGELAASAIGKAIYSKANADNERDFSFESPEVKFVGLKPKGKNQGISIVSRYLNGFKPFSMLVENLPFSKTKKDKEGKFKRKEPRHVTVRFQKKGEKDLDYKDLGRSKIPPFKNRGIHGYVYVDDKATQKGICDAVALNMLFGNVDINAKGNIGKLDNGQIGAIDFGHAFNNLIHQDGIGGHLVKGGGVHNQNGILDYINRDNVLGGSSKLWRDYEGMIPSEVFAASLHKMASTEEEVRAGMKNAYGQMLELAKEYGHDKDKQKMFIDSLQRLNRNIGKEDITDYKNLNELILKTTDNLQEFTIKRCGQMKEVAKMMDLQLEIDKQLKDKKSVEEVLKDPLVMAKRLEMIGKTGQSHMTWIKTGAKDEPHVGDLESYVNARKKQLVNDKIIEVAKPVVVDLRVEKDGWAAKVLNRRKLSRDSGIGASRSSSRSSLASG